jgi:2-amino-4-hydroxy-6-hydroxymethyldihydropteridine diphosphokinase
MAKVVIAVGSNLGDRLKYIQDAGNFLDNLSSSRIRKSSIWESEPVGPAQYTFLNSLAVIQTEFTAIDLLKKLKRFEQQLGRDTHPKKWGPRIIDLDIISYNNLVIQTENLIIPHPEYHNRLFVLLPLQELLPSWKDPVNGNSIDQFIKDAPDIMIRKTDLNW